MTLVPPTLPDYVFRSGEQVYQAPYTAAGVTLDGFVLEADPDSIDELLLHTLIEPSGGAVDYRCAHPFVVVAMADIATLRSSDQPDSLRGSMTERELSIWCLIADVKADDRLAWFLPYVFCDSGQTVVTGREVYGYPKQFAWFEDTMPIDLPAGAATSVWAGAIQTFAPTATVQPLEVGRIERTTAPLQPLATNASFVEEFDALFPGDLSVSVAVTTSPSPSANLAITKPGGTPPPSSGTQPWSARRVIQGFGGPGLVAGKPSLVASMVEDPTMVFLKQFRDARCPTKACYQAIVEAPLKVDPLGGSYAAYDPAGFTVQLAGWDSHPIHQSLGLASSQPLAPERVFRAEFGFQTLLGEELWRRP